MKICVKNAQEVTANAKTVQDGICDPGSESVWCKERAGTGHLQGGWDRIVKHMTNMFEESRRPMFVGTETLQKRELTRKKDATHNPLLKHRAEQHHAHEVDHSVYSCVLVLRCGPLDSGERN